MTLHVSVVSARRHPPEYELHKYWSRKPANVLRHFLRTLLEDGDVLVDPFCGSGVCLREAALLGATAYGVDVNPIAVALSQVTVAPPDPRAFAEHVRPILDRFGAVCREAYALPEFAQELRYVVHEVGTRCEGCGTLVWAADAQRQGRYRSCPSCGDALHFSLKSMRATRVVEAAAIGSRDPIVAADVCALEEQRSALSMYASKHDYDRPMWTNPRTLAHEGMTTRDLFTARNYSLVSWLADEFHAIEDASIREAALLMLTGAVAQCSRLIAYRGRLTTGGPAWTVPGFWVPPIHLESNPAKHLRARFGRFHRGLEALASTPLRGKATVTSGDAVEQMLQMRDAGERADVVFLDPPYGDSVPYVEFSTFWNAFFLRDVHADQDISVSDRTGNGGTWEHYESALSKTVGAAHALLRPEGRLLITFNSHDPRAWRSLLGSLQREGFRCQFVTYQVPAVVPTKAQFAPKTSYISDVYSIHAAGELASPYSQDLRPVERALKRCALARGGTVYRNLAYRTVAVEWMANNISVDLLEERDELIVRLFEGKGEVLQLRAPVPPGTPQLKELAEGIACGLLGDGSRDWHWLYEHVAGDLLDVGLPDPGELRSLLEDVIEIDGSVCQLRTAGADQLHLY